MEQSSMQMISNFLAEDTDFVNCHSDEYETVRKMIEKLGGLQKLKEETRVSVARDEAKAMMDIAAKRLAASLYTQYLKKCLRDGTPTGTVLDVLPDEVKRTAQDNEQKVWMITLNAKPKICPKKFWERFEEWLGKQDFFTAHIASLEQRSVGDDPADGYHIHLVGRSTIIKSVAIKKLLKSFSAFIEVRNCIQIDVITRDYENRVEYVKGNKHGKNEKERLLKTARVAKDRMIKEALGIPIFKEYNL